MTKDICRSQVIGHEWIVNLEVLVEPTRIADYQVRIEVCGGGYYRFRMIPSRFEPTTRYLGPQDVSDEWAEKTAREFCLETLGLLE